MAKFKVGDIVRINEQTLSEPEWYGKLYEIEEERYGCSYRLKDIGINGQVHRFSSFCSEWLIKVDAERKVTLGDLV